MVSTLLPYTLNLEPPRTTQQPPLSADHHFHACMTFVCAFLPPAEQHSINSQVKEPG